MRTLVNGVHINYEERGSGDALVFIHGLGGELSDWDKQVKYFSKKYRVIALDVRGFGQSDKPVEEYRFQTLAEDVAQLLKKLGVERTFVVGLSMGGFVTQRFAIDHGEMARAIVIADSACVLSPEISATMWERARLVETEGFGAIMSQSAATAYSAAFAERNPDWIAARNQRTMTVNDPVVYAAAARMCSKVNMVADLARITCPTLILVGDQDILTPRFMSDEIKQNIAGSRLKVIRNSGHACIFEQPGAFNRIVQNFLTEAAQKESASLQPAGTA